MSTDVFCLKSFQGHKFMSNDHSIQFCSNNETFFCWGEMMTATSSSGKGWSLVAVLTFGVVNSFLTLFFFWLDAAAPSLLFWFFLAAVSMVTVNEDVSDLHFEGDESLTDRILSFSLRTPSKPVISSEFFKKASKTGNLTAASNIMRLHNQTDTPCTKISCFLPFALVRNTLYAVSGTSLVSDCEPFGSSFHKPFCDKIPVNLWKDWRSLPTIDTVCQVKWLVDLGNNVNIHSGNTKNCLGRNFAEWFFFISLSDLFTQAREHSQNNRSFHLMCRVDCQNKSKCHADEITGLLDVCRPNDKTPDWWQTPCNGDHERMMGTTSNDNNNVNKQQRCLSSNELW